jgi:hypothetical protein
MPPNGPAAAALLSAAAGCFLLGALAVAADGSKALASALNFYNPTGPLAGVSTCPIVVWLVLWAVLARRWRVAQMPFSRIAAVSFALLALGILLTFPPFGDLLLGR